MNQSARITLSHDDLRKLLEDAMRFDNRNSHISGDEWMDMQEQWISDKLSEMSEGEDKLLTIKDYEEVIKEHERLVRELDVVINGENAAKQASLCDIISQCSTIFKPTPYQP